VATRALDDEGKLLRRSVDLDPEGAHQLTMRRRGELHAVGVRRGADRWWMTLDRRVRRGRGIAEARPEQHPGVVDAVGPVRAAGPLGLAGRDDGV
jgi:hypothetical protein